MEHLKFKEKLRALLVLTAWGFSIFFVFGAPGEISNVYSVNSATPERIKIENIYLTSERCGIRKLCDHVQFVAKNTATNLLVKERVGIEPGIFPFSVSSNRKNIWSSQRKYLGNYKVGEIYDAYLGNNGRYYLSKGSYFPFAYLFALSVVWLVGNAIVMARKI
ncbi:hypothetical protein [Microbulbifer aggregans]|uniref:hypothetical protein n=1 Tax=Microbulbifer aggregans TaxID=1769779 RepID=UPI001CFE5A8E|nr:hypothetical protein [Microbulbifer aggregans]